MYSNVGACGRRASLNVDAAIGERGFIYYYTYVKQQLAIEACMGHVLVRGHT